MVFTTQTILTVAFDTFSTTSEWPLFFFRFILAVFHCVHKYMLHFVFKVPSLYFFLRGRFILSMAFICSGNCCGTWQCHSIHIKGKHVNYVITRFTRTYKIYYVMTNWWSLWTWTASWIQFQGQGECENSISVTTYCILSKCYQFTNSKKLEYVHITSHEHHMNITWTSPPYNNDDVF